MSRSSPGRPQKSSRGPWFTLSRRSSMSPPSFREPNLKRAATVSDFGLGEQMLAISHTQLEFLADFSQLKGIHKANLLKRCTSARSILYSDKRTLSRSNLRF